MDAVGTVIQPCPSVADAYLAAAESNGLDRNRETIRQRFRQAISTFSVHAFQSQQGTDDPLRTNEASEIARWREIVNFVLSPPPEKQNAVFKQLWNHFGHADNWQLFEDVSPALSRLTDAGYLLGLASNFDQRLRPIVDRHLSSFDLKLFISSEVGWVKPAKAFYEHVTLALACEPHEILLIGDDWKNDVEGPQNFGWQALYLLRKQPPDDSDNPGKYATLDAAVDALLYR